jgi:membrane-bound hydrogenase subunit alpha
VAKMMENNNLADVPIIVAAIDPCFSCADRCLELLGEGRQLMEWNELRRRGVEWYRKNRGIDFSGPSRRLQMLRGDRRP